MEVLTAALAFVVLYLFGSLSKMEAQVGGHQNRGRLTLRCFQRLE